VKECDITKVQVLTDLFAFSPERRDEGWRDRFFENVVDASFRCETPQVFIGPDGFPYFSLLNPEPGKPFDSFCLCNLAEPATVNGFGIAINRRADGADWVFSYGDLLTYRLTGGFKTPPVPAMQTTEVTQHGEVVLSAAPSESYLPSYAKAVIRRFMQQSLKIQKPGVFLMLRRTFVPPKQIVFSIFRDDFATETELFNVLRRISWFLPRNYSITCVSKSSDLCKSFVPL
jgi:hypothetical protein